jgi:hypothetical protein
VRVSVGAWRAEVLTHAPALTATELIPADAPTRAPRNATPPRTAWDALREFFALTPAWLRAATVSAALVVCALAALAVANAEVGRENGNLVFRTGVWRTSPSDAPQTQTASAGGVNAAQLDQLVAERDAARRELEETRAQLDDSRAANIQAAYDVMDDSSQADAATQAAPMTQGMSKQKRAGGASARKSARRGASEDDLPRLIDLLSSGN